MTRSNFFILVFVYGALGAVSAFGGLAHVDEPSVATANAVPAPAVSGPIAPGLTETLRLAGVDFACGGLTRSAAALAPPAVAETSDEPDALRQLPEAPSSLVLGLTALAGLGLYHAGQTIRKVQFAPAPDWYHTGGPQQIGHATPLDLDSWDLPLCVLDEVTPEIPQIIRFREGAVLESPLNRLPVATAPRAPPLFSSTID